MYRFTFALLFFCLIGCDSNPQIEFRLAELQPVDGWSEMAHRPGEQSIWVSPKAVVTNSHVDSSYRTQDNMGYPAVGLKLTDQGSNVMWDVSSNQVGKPLAILFNGELLSAPVINSPFRSDVIIQGGRGGFEPKQLDRILDAFSKE